MHRVFKCETRGKSFLRRKKLESHEQICQKKPLFIVVLRKSCSEIGPILETKGMRAIFQKKGKKGSIIWQFEQKVTK